MAAQFGYEKLIKIAQNADDGILFLKDINEICSASNTFLNIWKFI